MPHILYIYTIYIYIYICSRAYRAVHFILRCFSVLFYDSSTWVGGCVTHTFKHVHAYMSPFSIQGRVYKHNKYIRIVCDNYQHVGVNHHECSPLSPTK